MDAAATPRKREIARESVGWGPILEHLSHPPRRSNRPRYGASPPPLQTDLKAKTCVLEAVRALRGRQEAAQVEEGMAHTQAPISPFNAAMPAFGEVVGS